MRLMIIIMLFSFIYLASAKNNVKQLTESMGQEVIEIRTPIKEVPMGLEEEPSAEDESDADEKSSVKVTGNTAAPAKKDVKKANTQTSVKKDVKEAEKIEDEDEARIEKELSEIYKDTADYKSDSAEEKEVAKEMETPAPVQKTTKIETSAEDMDTDKEIGRQRNHFKFQPDSTDKASIERFRTSVDDIYCSKRHSLKGTSPPINSESSGKNDAFRVISDGILLITAVLSYVFICS